MAIPGRRFKRVSGNAVGRNSKRILGCENCNFMQLHSTPPKATNSASHEVAATGLNPMKNVRCLKILRSQHIIDSLRFQTPYVLHAPGKDGKLIPLYKYVSDFDYYIQDDKSPDGLRFVVEDVKPKGGIVTDVFMMKKKHFEAEYGIDISIVER